MDSAVKAAWVAALRSGDYRRGTLRLRDDDRYCCLGVLCELHRKARGGRWEKHSHVDDEWWYNDGGFRMPPREVLEWAGLGVRTSYQSSNVARLVSMNDAGSGFDEIADAIEELL